MSHLKELALYLRSECNRLSDCANQAATIAENADTTTEEGCFTAAAQIRDLLPLCSTLPGESIPDRIHGLTLVLSGTGWRLREAEEERQKALLRASEAEADRKRRAERYQQAEAAHAAHVAALKSGIPSTLPLWVTCVLNGQPEPEYVGVERGSKVISTHFAGVAAVRPSTDFPVMTSDSSVIAPRA